MGTSMTIFGSLITYHGTTMRSDSVDHALLAVFRVTTGIILGQGVSGHFYLQSTGLGPICMVKIKSATSRYSKTVELVHCRGTFLQNYKAALL